MRWLVLLPLLGGCGHALADIGDDLQDARGVLYTVCLHDGDADRCEKAIQAYDVAIRAYGTAYQCREAADNALEAADRLRDTLTESGD